VRESMRRSRKTKLQELNITPLIDMVFILLIFFIVTTSFVKETGVDIQRPSARTAVVDERTSLLIGVNEAGEVYIAGERVDVRMIRNHVVRFQAQTPEGAVVVVADKSSRTGTLVDVLDECRRAGVSNLSIAARLPEP
jgi:biopolymer transport protein ExbD